MKTWGNLSLRPLCGPLRKEAGSDGWTFPSAGKRACPGFVYDDQFAGQYDQLQIVVDRW